jgi:hypothetical protein
VYSLSRWDDSLYAGGYFLQIGGSTRWGASALSIAAGTATGSDPQFFGTIYSLASNGSRVYVGGSYTKILTLIPYVSRINLAAFDSGLGSVYSWDPDPNGDVLSLLLHGTSLYVAGDFSSIAGQSRARIAEFNTGTDTITSWNPNANGTVRAMAIYGTSMFAGGDFTTVRGRIRNGIAEIDLVTGDVK